MKKLLLILALFVIVNTVQSQIDTSIWSLQKNQVDGKYSLLTNKTAFYGIGIGTIKVPLQFSLADIDTSIYSLKKNQSDGKYSIAINKVSIYGIDSGMIKVSVIYNMNGGINTATPYTWTGTQTFSTIIANLLVINHIDSTQSIRLYDTSGTLYALFSSDTSWIPNLTVGNLNSTTIINGSSVTTNSLISDTLISNSPLHLRTDSLFFGVLNDTSKVWYREITTANSTRGSIYPNVNLGSDLGLTTNQFRNIRGRTLNADSVIGTTYKIGGIRMYSIADLYLASTAGLYAPQLILISNQGIDFNAQANTNLFQVTNGQLGLKSIDTTARVSFYAYNQYKNSGESYRRLKIGWTADSTAVISTENAGQYTARPLNIFQNAGYTYLVGNESTDGSWRMSATSSGAMLIEARITGTWTTKQTLTF